MKTTVYFCNCGTNVSERIDSEKVKAGLSGVDCFKTVDFLCAEEGLAEMEADIKADRPDRVVIAACSPRDHEATFRGTCSRAGMNPYLMQMVNIREQVAWVTPDPDRATEKATRHIKAAVARVALQEPLEDTTIDVSTAILIIGAGPAGLKAAQALAEAGRRVTLVEKTAAIGGLPVLYNDIAPNMECGPCMLEPLLADILHGKYAGNIELLTLSEVHEVVGYYGNFTVKIRKQPRYVDTATCIGCGECATVCPATTGNDFHFGLGERKAIDMAYAGALPNFPSLDMAACVRSRGEDCRACQQACPVGESVINFNEAEQEVVRSAGAIVVATGAALYDCTQIPNLGYRAHPGVRTSLEFERLMASNGPTAGAIQKADGTPIQSVAIVHCVGSLDTRHQDYCSSICCRYAFKFNHAIHTKLPDARVFHLYKEIVLTGKEDPQLFRKASENPHAKLVRYQSISDLTVSAANASTSLTYRDAAGHDGKLDVDLVVLCPAVVPGPDTERLSQVLDTTRDRIGFFEELHGRLDAGQSKLKGIYLAGTCQAPMDIQKAMSQGMAAAGYVLAGLVEGRKLEVDPVKAAVDSPRCSGCGICALVCPYKAISFDRSTRVASVNAVLCQGCGTCVAACPAGAIKGNHFTDRAIMAEIEELLA